MGPDVIKLMMLLGNAVQNGRKDIAEVGLLHVTLKSRFKLNFSDDYIIGQGKNYLKSF